MGSPGEARVEQVMSRRVLTCPPDTPVPAVARRMAEERIHCLIVSGASGRHGDEQLAWGVVADTDVVALCARAQTDRSAGEVAHETVYAVEPGDAVGDAARLMSEHGTTHLVVVDPADGRPVGVISTLDVARAVGRDGPA